MCLGLYLASDSPLPLVPFTPENPAFNVALLQPSEESVRRQFSKPHVVYVGSSTHCGCGFQPDAKDDEPGSREGHADRYALAAYISDAARHGSLELFVCWDGDYEVPPERRFVLEPDDLGNRTDWVSELSYVSIQKLSS